MTVVTEMTVVKVVTVVTIVIEMTVGTVVRQKQNYEDKEEEKNVRKSGYTKSVMAKKKEEKKPIKI